MTLDQAIKHCENYKNVTSYSVQRIVNYLEHDMGRV